MREIDGVAGVERDQVPQRRGIRLLEPRRNLGEAGVAGDEWWATGGGSLGGDHPKRLREDRWHHARVRQREQVSEVAVLERTGEQRLDTELGRGCLERFALGPESDDDEPRRDPGERIEEDVHAL